MLSHFRQNWTSRASAADRCQLQRLVGAKRVVTPRGSAMNEHRETRFVEDIHPIVACHRIRADADANSRVYQRQQWGDTVSELRV